MTHYGAECTCSKYHATRKQLQTVAHKQFQMLAPLRAPFPALLQLEILLVEPSGESFCLLTSLPHHHAPKEREADSEPGRGRRGRWSCRPRGIADDAARHHICPFKSQSL